MAANERDDQLNIWDLPVNPGPEIVLHLKKRYGMWETGKILTTREVLERYCSHLNPGFAKLTKDTSNLTIDELRAEGSAYFLEADRLLALPSRKMLFALRVPDQKDPVFIDKNEKAVRLWALENPNPGANLYREEWVDDVGKWRVLTREFVDNPVASANSNRSQK